MVAHRDPPAVARQRVRRVLRALRRDQSDSPSQGDVAKRLGWSLSKMQRIEGGEVGVSPTDLRALLQAYGVDDPDEVGRLLEDARVSRRQRYMMAPEHRKHLPPGLQKLMQFEEQAVSIRIYQPASFPGILQTSAVAEAMLAFWGNSLSEETLRVRHRARMSRRKRVMERMDGPEYFIILDESVIKREVRNAKTTAEQLQDVAALAGRPHMHIRIVPFAKGAHMPALGPFQILTLSGDDGDDVLYREEFDRDDIVHGSEEVDFRRDAFEKLWHEALSEEATRQAVISEARQLLSSLDRERRL
jgi:hypothetical protein